MVDYDIDSSPIVTETLMDGVRYRLPRKQFGKVGWSLFLMGSVMGFFFTIIPMTSLLNMLGEMDGKFRDQIDGGFIASCLMIALFISIGSSFLSFGFWFVLGRTTVSVQGDQLLATESLGPFRWTFKRPLGSIARLVLDRRGKQIGYVAVKLTGQMEGLIVRFIGIQMANKKRGLIVAPGYTYELLQPLAQKLSERISQIDGAKLLDDKSRIDVWEVGNDKNSIFGDADETGDAQSAIIQPEDSPILVSQREDGLTLTVPPVGVFKNKAGLFSFGIIWCSFMAVFTGMTLWDEGVSTGDIDGFWEGAMFVCFILLFWTIGIGMLVAGWNMGRRQSVIDVVGDTLLFTQIAPLGQKQYEWRASEIESIVYGPSGIASNDVPIMCLLVTPKEGKKRKLLTGRPNDELRWLASTLCHALKLHAT